MGLTKKEREELRRIRTAELYSYMHEFSSGGVAVGLDEVGRGPLAGPLTVAAVALPEEPQIVGLDDSKKLSAKRREELAAQVRGVALGLSIVHIAPDQIDACGMTVCLRVAFTRALAGCGVQPDVVLLDGNPLHIHEREVNIVKGDGKVACIAAASIVAKVARDALMVEADERFPEYGLASNKGYGTAAHIAAIKEHGPCELHRMSFLGNILAEQQSLL